MCFERAENDLFNGEPVLDGSNVHTYEALSFCQCLPQCESLKYEIELVKTNYKTHLVDYMTIASLKVFFKDNEFVPLKRFQLYGTVDFLANCGITDCAINNSANDLDFESTRRWLTRSVRRRFCLVDRRDFLLFHPEVSLSL